MAEMMLHAAFAECKLCYLFYTVGMFDLTVQPCAPGCVSRVCGVCLRVCAISCSATRESILKYMGIALLTMPFGDASRGASHMHMNGIIIADDRPGDSIFDGFETVLEGDFLLTLLPR